MYFKENQHGQAGKDPHRRRWTLMRTGSYSDTALTASAGTTSSAMTAQLVNSTYGTIVINGTTYYVAASDVVRGYTGSGYTIDRWLGSGNDGIVSISDNGLTISATKIFSFIQRFYFPFENLSGKYITISALTNENQILVASGVAPLEKPDKNYLIANSLNPSIGRIQFRYSHNYFISLEMLEGKSATFIAAKFELGEHQTLAHQDADGNWMLNDPPPNKAIELLKCQRYYQLFSSELARPASLVDYRPPMRTNPALGTIVINGTTYYTADANL